MICKIVHLDKCWYRDSMLKDYNYIPPEQRFPGVLGESEPRNKLVDKINVVMCDRTGAVITEFAITFTKAKGENTVSELELPSEAYPFFFRVLHIFQPMLESKRISTNPYLMAQYLTDRGFIDDSPIEPS